MAALVLGEFIRVMWRAVDVTIADALARPDTNAREAAALLKDGAILWGLVPNQEVRLAGQNLRRAAAPAELVALLEPVEAKLDAAYAAAQEAWNYKEDDEKRAPFPDRDDQLHVLTDEERTLYLANKGWDEPIETELCLPELPTATLRELPTTGRWLVSVENAGHCWAALRGVKRVTADSVRFDWAKVVLPGAGELVFGRPIYSKCDFDLIYPPPEQRERQAALNRDHRLPFGPFRASKGGASVGVSPLYRFGLLENGAMRWLDLKPGHHSVTATPLTAQFRARLDLLRRELAARGVYYEDDAHEAGYEARWALEDCVVPASFHEPDAPMAMTVSGEGDPEEDKREQAREIYDPDHDLEVDWLREFGTYTMPARKDVTVTTVYFSDIGKIDGQPVTMGWMGELLTRSAEASGLSCDGYRPGWRTTDLAMMDREPLQPEGWGDPASSGGSIVDASDRVQRAAWALVTGGIPDLDVEAQLSRYRGMIVRSLLARDAIFVADAGDWPRAVASAAALHPLAPGPFPRRAYAVIPLAEAGADAARRPTLVTESLAAVVDPLERRMALLSAERAGGDPIEIATRAAPWGEDAGFEAHRWSATILEPLLGSLDPPVPPAPGSEVDDGQQIVPPALTRLAKEGPAAVFREQWHAVELTDRESAGGWLLRCAVAADRFDVAELLLADGVAVSGAAPVASNALGQWGGDTPLSAAIEAGSLPAVRWCLAHGADAAAAEWSRGRTRNGEIVDWSTPALVLAAKHGHPDIVRCLIERGGEAVIPMANGVTPLSAAAFGGSKEVVELLLAAGADANQQPIDSEVEDGPTATTPLLYACDRGHDSIVRLLLSRGADPGVPRGDGELALQLAMEGCALATIEAILAAGADGAAVNRAGLSMLHTAMLKRRADVVPLLLARGAPIELPAGASIAMMQADAEPGWTALMIAAAQGDSSSVAALLQAGANPLATDEDGRTALDTARLAADPSADVDPYDEVISILEQAERASAV